MAATGGTTRAPGEVVTAVVTRVEHYGVYLECGGAEIIVLIPDTSYEPIRLREVYAPGDVATVRIQRYIPETKQYKATIRDV